MKHLSCWVGRFIVALKIGLPGRATAARSAEFQFSGFFAFDRSIWTLQCRLPLASRLAD
jgi:hypothetical protein